MGVSAPSLHRESTDSLITQKHIYKYLQLKQRLERHLKDTHRATLQQLAGRWPRMQATWGKVWGYIADQGM